MSPSAPATDVPHPGLGFGAFVFMMAGFMALNGLAIDSMLPALPLIGDEYGLVEANRPQLVVTAYLLGFGAFQIFFGPVSDRFGRRGPLLAGVALYALFSVAALFTTTFEALLLTRVLQGIGAAATRTLTIAIVRDNYSGRRMASVTSLIFIVFLAAPVIAPTLGQGIILIASWQWIFALLASLSSLLLLWALARLPESLREEHRLPLSPARIGAAFLEVVRTRHSIGYALAMTLVLGSLFGFINSAQQIFSDVFEIPDAFTLVFAGIALCMAVASYLNSRIVERLGTRRVSHAAILGFATLCALNLVTALAGVQTLVSFSVLLGATMFCFGLTASNFGAMAMEPVGHIAGTASSVQGCISTLGGALIGLYIGQRYDGTTVPLLVGFTALAVAATGVVLLTEGGLFRPSERSGE